MLEPKVSIVVPNYNGSPLIESCIKSVLKTLYPDFEVVIVDDKSTDGSIELIERLYGFDPRLTIIRNRRWLGKASSINLGVKKAKGDYIAFIETDMEVKPDWLNEAMKILREEESIGAVQSKILDIEDRKRINAIGIYIIPYTGWVIDRGFGEDDIGTYDQSEEVGAGEVGLVVKREVIDRIGGFDEKIVRCVDDIDFGWRIWLAGYRIISAPKSIAYHWIFKPWKMREKAISKTDWEFHFNKMPRIFLKNYEFRNMIKYLFWALLIGFIRGLVYLGKKRPEPLIGFIKATVWNLRILADTMKERRRVQHLIRKVPDEYLLRKIMVTGSLMTIRKSALQTRKAKRFHEVLSDGRTLISPNRNEPTTKF